MPKNSDLKILVLTLQKQIKEPGERTEPIHGIPPIVKDIDMDKYSHNLRKQALFHFQLQRNLKYQIVAKYDGTIDS